MSSTTIIDIAIYLLLGVAFAGFITAVLRVRKADKELASSELIRTELAEGEKRILDFLHHLGLSIDRENTHQHLYKVIVEGVCEVSLAKGGALYILDETEQFLKPAFISEHCAQLVPDPVTDDPTKIPSLLRLSTYNRYEGILGNALAVNTTFLTDSLKAHPALSLSLIHI